MLETIRLGSDALDGVVMDSNSSVTMKSKQFTFLLMSFRSAAASKHHIGRK